MLAMLGRQQEVLSNGWTLLLRHFAKGEAPARTDRHTMTAPDADLLRIIAFRRITTFFHDHEIAGAYIDAQSAVIACLFVDLE
jgi:hypothetical protein